jgi:hypothetical protein
MKKQMIFSILIGTSNPGRFVDWLVNWDFHHRLAGQLRFPSPIGWSTETSITDWLILTSFRPFGFIALLTLIYMTFQSFDFDEVYSRSASWTYLMEVIPETRRERTWWRLFQKRVVRTKFNIYFFLLHVIAIDKFIVHHNKQLKYTKKSLKIPKG